MNHVMRQLNGNQDEVELAQFLDLVVRIKARRYLEIGSRNGDSFYAVMMAIGRGGFGLSIDLGETYAARKNLNATVAQLREVGIAVEVIFGSSRNPYVLSSINRVCAHDGAPFDLVLIDADHRYDGVKADWDDYAHLAPVVAIHDVAAPPGWVSDGHPNDVPAFWADVKNLVGSGKWEEIVNPGSKMGYGITYR